MRCPLCSGPVHRDDEHFECEVGHWVSDDRMLRATELELIKALWAAIQALDNEADVLRAIGGMRGARFADEAERQTRDLRDFARQHATRVEDLVDDDS